MNLNTPTQPSVSEYAVLFFDGVCGLCNHTVDFVLKHDRRGIVRFAPLQGRTAKECLIAEDRERFDSVIFQQGGLVFKKSSAVVRLLHAMGGVWSLLGAMLWLVPSPLRDFCYGLIARNRYRFFGRKETCRILKPEERARFCE